MPTCRGGETYPPAAMLPSTRPIVLTVGLAMSTGRLAELPKGKFDAELGVMGEPEDELEVCMMNGVEERER